jgi:hypothetical protein
VSLVRTAAIDPKVDPIVFGFVFSTTRPCLPTGSSSPLRIFGLALFVQAPTLKLERETAVAPVKTVKGAVPCE